MGTNEKIFAGELIMWYLFSMNTLHRWGRLEKYAPLVFRCFVLLRHHSQETKDWEHGPSGAIAACLAYFV